MGAKGTTSDPNILRRHVSFIRSTGKCRVTINDLPALGSLKGTSTLDLESLDPQLQKVAKKLAKRVWKGAKLSAVLVCIAPYLPVVLFLVLCDWAQHELDEKVIVKRDVESISSDWSQTTLVNWEEACEDWKLEDRWSDSV
ncbi:hypothetical protein PG993_003094 [Apiospora rasikravindrae]|uniref:Uncharacterized protein n=1 Tax=Apiospora rasikravindrae TaxID=990691 RepID=A0ABR1U197_9PEZI